MSVAQTFGTWQRHKKIRGSPIATPALTIFSPEEHIMRIIKVLF
jgi:hypothetical protein